MERERSCDRPSSGQSYSFFPEVKTLRERSVFQSRLFNLFPGGDAREPWAAGPPAESCSLDLLSARRSTAELSQCGSSLAVHPADPSAGGRGL